ncbi:MAG: hypothetical protein ACJZ9F_05340 [Rhodospirillaceae bacterium]
MRSRLVTSAIVISSLSFLPSLAFASGQMITSDTFCTSVQLEIMANQISAENSVHSNYESFVLSKPTVNPLRNEQYTTRGPHGQPRMVSCKMKAPDHIREVYGKTASNKYAQSCETINRENVLAVIASLTPDEALRRVILDQQIIFDEDKSVITGQSWIKSFDFVYLNDNGDLHIQSKRMQIDWNSLLFQLFPDRFRGMLYCHLIAPEYAKALLLGEVSLKNKTD